jgi:hypothetical protein
VSRALLRCALGALALALSGIVGLVPAVPAGAHPFGDPQTVEVDRADSHVVRVRWRVGMSDDLTYLAMFLGLLPEDRVMLDGALLEDESDPALLAGSERLDGYLLQHVVVRAGGEACVGALVDKSDLLQTGATLEFTCPEAVASAQVAVSMLTDLSPDYRTLASGPNGERAVYDDDHVEQTWTFGPQAAGDDLGRSAAVQIAMVLGAALLVGAVALSLVRRRRTRVVADDDEPADTTGLVPAGRQD